MMDRDMHTQAMPMVRFSPPSPMNKVRRIGRRGFTLAELMAVVAIIGVLATIAVVSYRKYVNSARSSEAVWMVNGIRAAQEAYRAETLTYLDVSESLENYYPTTTPGAKKVAWGAATDDIGKKWRILNVSTDGAVMYGYATVAGPPGDVVPDGLFVTTTFPKATEPWYVIQAKGDIDGNGVFSHYVGTSFSNEVYWENEGE